MITFEDKEDIRTVDLPRKNYVGAADLNEIKGAVNSIASPEYKEVLVSSAQLLDLHNNPVTLIIPPDNGKYLNVKEIIMECNFGGTPYDYTGSQLAIVISSQNQTSNISTSILTDNKNNAVLLGLESINQTSASYTSSLVFESGSPFENGNGTILFKIKYTIETFGSNL